MTEREKQLEQALREAGFHLLYAAAELMKHGDDDNAKILIDASDKAQRALSAH